MNIKTKKILIIAVPLTALMIAIVVTLLYNSGIIGNRDYGYCFREGGHNEWFKTNRGFGRGFHGQGMGRDRGVNRMDFGMNNVFIFILVFTGIIGVYLVFRTIADKKQNSQNQLKCTNCNSALEKDWKTCPFCGHQI